MKYSFEAAEIMKTHFYLMVSLFRIRLSGTGFGLQLSANSLEEVEVITGGYNAEFGQATSGVINARTKEGKYDEYNFYLSYKRDNLGFNKNSTTSFNTDIIEANLSGPEPISKYLFNA